VGFLGLGESEVNRRRRQVPAAGFMGAHASGNTCVESVSDSNIWRVNLSDLRELPKQLIASTRVDNNPQYSPDGKKIAFESSRSANQEVWVCDADGSNALQLVAMGRSGSPRWSPDGRQIAFDSNVEGSWQIYTISAQGGRPRRMTRSSANNNTPSWSHDGNWIYFASDRTGGSPAWQIWKIPAGGGEPVQVTRLGGYSPFESHDGTTIYHPKSHGISAPLWKVPAAGGEESQVLDSVYPAAYAATRSGIYFVSHLADRRSPNLARGLTLLPSSESECR
jgi:tricorn protease-like protein